MEGDGMKYPVRTMKKAHKIYLKRKDLFEHGNIKLISVLGKKGKMEAINEIGIAEAKEYNRLADIHAKMKL